MRQSGILTRRVTICLTMLFLGSSPTSSASAKDTLVNLMQDQDVTEDEVALSEAVATGKARFVSLLGTSTNPSTVMRVNCSFVSQPATQASEGPSTHPSGVPGLLAFRLVGAGDVLLLESETSLEVILPAGRIPVMGPYLQCAVYCSTGPCTDIHVDAYLSTK